MTPPLLPSPSYSLVAGTFNTHVSDGLHNGALEWLLERAPRVSLWFLQEVRDRAHVENALHFAGVRDEWAVLGQSPHGASPYVLARRSRFRFVGPAYVRDLKPAQYPRRQAEYGLIDLRTNRLTYASSVHVDPLGRGFEDALPGPRLWHENQVQAYADRAGSHDDGEDVVIYGGDINERLNQLRFVGRDLRERHAMARFRQVGMRPAFQLAQLGTRDVDLDDVFVRPSAFLSVRRRRLLKPPHKGIDHAAVIVRLSVKGL